MNQSNLAEVNNLGPPNSPISFPLSFANLDHGRSPSESYTHYLDPNFSLENRINAVFKQLNVPTQEKEEILCFLGPLRIKHFATYEHCLRVGLLSRQLASFFQLDQKALFLAGLLHDIGKAQTSLEVLSKTSGWTTDDQAAIQEHVMDGYRLLRGKFDFSAEIILWHHRFQTGGYPEILPKPLHEYSLGTQTIIPQYGRVLALADTFDALHRINDKHGEKRALSGEEIKAQMITFNPDKKDVIESLYRNSVLTTHIFGNPNASTEELDKLDPFHALSFSYTDKVRTPDNTRRHIAIACSLEALSDKIGCTTRYQDASRHLKLEYFITAGINISEAFARMAAEINKDPTLAKGLYIFAYQAQLESKRNRRGGRVNQGIIELLTPIVAAQHLEDPSYSKRPEEILELAGNFLQKTDRTDVENLILTKELAYELSHYKRDVPHHSSVTTVADYYRKELETGGKATSLAHNREFINGFPTIHDMCNTIANSQYPHLNQRVEEAYQRARAVHSEEVGSGFLADCVAVAIYLHLSQNLTQRIVG